MMRCWLSLLFLSGCGASVGGESSGVDARAESAACSPAEPPPTSCDGGIENLTESIQIDDCTDFDELPKGCWSLDKTLVVTGHAVTSVARLGALQRVGALALDDTSLITFDTVSPIVVTDGISIEHNNDLESLDHIELDDDLKYVKISDNSALTQLALNEIAEPVEVEISRNRNLEKLELGAVRIGKLSIVDHSELVEVALPSLNEVSTSFNGLTYGDLVIQRAPRLTSLRMPVLHDVAGSLQVANTGLGSLVSLGTSIAVGGELRISGNAALVDLGQLDHARKIGGSIDISSNSQLEFCRADAVRCCVHNGGFSGTGNLGSSCTQSQWCDNDLWTDGCVK